jgi:hypothetical protein
MLEDTDLINPLIIADVNDTHITHEAKNDAIV